MSTEEINECRDKTAARVAEEEKLIEKLLPEDQEEGITPEFIKKCYWRGETGLGELYGALHRGKFVYNNTTDEWLKYEDHHWSLDELNNHIPAIEDVIDLLWGEIRRLKEEKQKLDPDDDKGAIKTADNTIKGLRKKINYLYDLKGKAACIRAARIVEKPLAVTSDVFDREPLLLACPNGVINLRTGLMSPGQADDYLFFATPVPFHGTTPSEDDRKLWEDTLYAMFESWEMVHFIKRFFGYVATGSTAEQVFCVASGSGRNGKRVLIETIMNVLGQYAIPIKSDLLLVQKNKRSAGGPTPELCALDKVRLAVASEVNENAVFDAAEIKRLSGSDKISVRVPHGKRETYQEQTHQLIIQVNDDPKCPGGDAGFWERMIKIYFPFKFVKRKPAEPNERRADKDLFEKLREIYPAILGWLVEGSVEYHKIGLAPPKVVLDATKEYQEDEDIIGRWVKADVEKNLQAQSGATVLYASFVKFYHETTGDREPSQQWFGKQLKKRFPKLTKGGYVYYLGIKLKDEPMETGETE